MTVSTLRQREPLTLSAGLQPRQLAVAAVLAMAGHAVLLFGVPKWWTQVRPPGIRVESLVTRMIMQAPPAPTPLVEPPMPAPDLTPAPMENALRQKPKPVPRPRPAVRTETLAVSPSLKTDSLSEIVAAEPTLLVPHVGPSVGGPLSPFPITPSLSDIDRLAAHAQMKGIGDAPVRVSPPGDLVYKVIGLSNGVVYNDGSSTLKWHHDGNFYNSSWYFYRVKIGYDWLSARGLLTPQGLAPASGMHHVTAERKIRFDYPGKRLHFGDEGGTSAELPAGAQDRFSVLIQLGALLAGAPDRYPPGTAIRLPMASSTDVAPATFTVEAEETLVALGDKNLKTVRLVHTPTRDGEPKIELWLGPQIEYLPVRMRVTQPNGDFAEHTVVSAKAVSVPPYEPPAPRPALPASQASE